MAIRIVNMKQDGKRLINYRQLDAAKYIQQVLKEAGIEADVEVSRWYVDRWFDLEWYKQILERDVGPRK